MFITIITIFIKMNDVCQELNIYLKFGRHSALLCGQLKFIFKKVL